LQSTELNRCALVLHAQATLRWSMFNCKVWAYTAPKHSKTELGNPASNECFCSAQRAPAVALHTMSDCIRSRKVLGFRRCNLDLIKPAVDWKKAGARIATKNAAYAGR
jgi:hypothetical protein